MKVKTGLQVNLPSSANPGEPLFTTDQGRLFVGTGTGLVEFPNLSYVTSAIAAAVVVVKAYVDAAIAGLGALYQLVSGKDAANGYAGLDGSGLIHPSELPTPTTSTFGGVKDLAAVVHRFVTSIVNGVPISAQPAASDLSDGTTGSGAVVLAASPALSGIPIAPTAILGTNTTQIATTAFVQSAVLGGTDVDSLSTLSDVTLSSLSNGQFLEYNGSAWVNHTLVAGDIPNIAESQVTSLVSDLAAKVPTSRLISTTVPLTGGGDLSANRTLAISDFVGDSGSGGAKGAVPAPSAGDAAAGKVLKADGTWATVGGLSSPLTTKGDIWGYSTVDIRIPIGTNGQWLVADSTQALGLKWDNQPFDLGFNLPGLPAANTSFLIWEFTRQVIFPGNFSGAKGKCLTTPTAATVVFTISKNGSSVGTVTIASSGTFTFASSGGTSVTFNIGDYMTITTPTSADATLADVGWVLAGTR